MTVEPSRRTIVLVRAKIQRIRSFLNRLNPKQKAVLRAYTRKPKI